MLEFDKNEFNSLLAPEDMALLQSNHLDNDGNDQSEMFAIGATILSTATLDTMHPSVYNVKERAINLNALREKKLNFGEGQKYSDIFKALVLNLVAVSPSDRLTSD